ncbi:hypothetical protein GWI33_020786 [Rhynchophorus ferrugineus]|uniref:Uncharacterized protein n=1 Tax=Rhynchophorus ferrugineus TaxID=354439 RepID=A0A834HQ04_RHYFE|nr:hypothetical protein GWI33_020786 [Rhynchophorus ferrugineus]
MIPVTPVTSLAPVAIYDFLSWRGAYPAQPVSKFRNGFSTAAKTFGIYYRVDSEGKRVPRAPSPPYQAYKWLSGNLDCRSGEYLENGGCR